MKCIECGKKLIGQQTKFCSKKCNSKNYYKNHKKYTTLKCKFCGLNFIRKKGMQKYCSEKCRLQARYSRHHKKIKKRARKNWINRTYGLSLKQFEHLKNINDKCWICGNRSHTTLCIDHNHKTGKLRGLLCHNCNKTLGILKNFQYLLINQ